jgi:lipooligosaccharide transport system ATP-binding protein
MDEGRIVSEGSPEGLRERVTGPEVVELVVPAAQHAALAAALGDGARGHQSDGDLLLLFTEDAGSLADAVRARAPAAEVRAARKTGLEDVFLMLTGRRLREAL